MKVFFFVQIAPRYLQGIQPWFVCSTRVVFSSFWLHTSMKEKV